MPTLPSPPEASPIAVPPSALMSSVVVLLTSPPTIVTVLGAQAFPLPPPPPPPAPPVPRERDSAQRIGDALYPLVARIRESRAGIFGVVALFGITVPIILLRQRFDVRARVILAFLTFWFWIGLLGELF